jgi:hypothetical protein
MTFDSPGVEAMNFSRQRQLSLRDGGWAAGNAATEARETQGTAGHLRVGVTFPFLCLAARLTHRAASYKHYSRG